MVALAVGGVAFSSIQIVAGTGAGVFPIPPGDTLIWDRVGDQLRAGAQIYYTAEPLTDSFWYAPPWAVAFATVSWLPVPALHLMLVGVKIAALRIIGGSWLGAGIACWFPLVAFDIASGSFNLLMAGAIVAAVRGQPRLAVVAALAKFGPILAIDTRSWRQVVRVALLAAVVTLPWAWLWPAWVGQLATHIGAPLGPQIPVPLAARWAVAIVLLLSRRPVARALAATIAIPAFYWGSLVVLIAPVAIFVRGTLEPRSAPS